MQETLKILESVNQFYSQSFNQLVMITVAVLAFAGVVMPIIISLYQKRLFRLEHEEIKTALKNELAKDLNKAIDTLRTEHEKLSATYEDRIKELNERTKKKIAQAIGGISHVQANVNLDNKEYLWAFTSLVSAAKNHIKADEEANLRRTLRLIYEKCLPELNKAQLEKDERNIESFYKLISTLEDYNVNNRYEDDLQLLKIKFKAAMNKESKKSA